MMKKTLLVLIMLIAAAFTTSAEGVWYQVKYANEFNNVQTVKYLVDTDITTEDAMISENVDLYTFVTIGRKYNEIIDKDSDARDLAIVNKLDKQGYTLAGTDFDGNDCQICYVKAEGKWHKVYGEE